MSGATVTPIGAPNATTGAPTTITDQVFAEARNFPDFISKASVLAPAVATQFTGKAMLASKTFYGTILVLVVTEVARRAALGWDADTVNLVAGVLDLVALSGLRAISRTPITGFFRAATPAETIAKVTTATTT